MGDEGWLAADFEADVADGLLVGEWKFLIKKNRIDVSLRGGEKTS